MDLTHHDTLIVGAPARLPSLSSVAGTISLTVPLTLPIYSLAGGRLIGAAELTVTEQFTWLTGIMTGGGTTTITGDLQIVDFFNKTLGDRTLVVDGMATWSDGTLFWTGSVTVINNGTFNITGPVHSSLVDGALPMFENAGTLIRTGEGVAQLSATLNNTGTLAVRSRTLQVGSGVLAGDNLTTTGVLELVHRCRFWRRHLHRTTDPATAHPNRRRIGRRLTAILASAQFVRSVIFKSNNL